MSGAEKNLKIADGILEDLEKKNSGAIRKLWMVQAG